MGALICPLFYSLKEDNLMAKELTDQQRDELIEQYVEIVVDNMDTKTLVQYITEDLTDVYNDYSDDELKDQIEMTHDKELYDELIDNVTNETVEVN